MPFVLLEVRKKYSPEQEIALMNAVHSAIQDAFKKPDDINIRLLAHEPHRFPAPSTKTHPELYMNISIDCIAGRSIAAKRNLYRLIIENLGQFGIPKDHVKILLRETSSENWGIRGGQAACDVELGYTIEV
ncbi:tautomerase family protein [Candidatus Berkiella cookevillensis]|uniref:4-oxalocrotonate tautomerase n=1 Tax=Candidatus Berkiella cookevillensis TaxID=437022 RepID=A0A0Q9YA21_9GAMM|nr:tautomerase family protein [Candidatus Berkiella cookevillensis]MCS5707954.1 tautomerase family protein [Candidatus Berkiella cookevillensis]